MHKISTCVEIDTPINSGYLPMVFGIAGDIPSAAVAPQVEFQDSTSTGCGNHQIPDSVTSL